MAMAKPPKMMSTSSSHRLTAQAAFFYLLIAFLLVEGTLARKSLTPRLTTTSSTGASPLLLLRRYDAQSTDAIHRSHRRNHDSNESFGRSSTGLAAFLYRSRHVISNSASRKAIVCNHHHADESAINPLESILSIRGGASSSPSNNNAVQTILKSLMASPSLPAPIKQVIEMICQFIENLTGWKVLPRVEEIKQKKKHQSKSKKTTKSVEEVGVGATKKERRSKSRSETKVEDLDEVQMAAVAQKKKKKRKSQTTALEPKQVETSEPKKTKTTTSEKASPTTPTPPTTTPPPPPKPKPKPKRPDMASQKFLSNKMKSSNPNYRIQRELKEFLTSPPPGLTVKISGKNVRLWVITLTMPPNTIYANETYKLRVQFPNDYPTSPPSVYFLNPTPRHEHVYTNGDICLSLLGKDWRPIMTASSVAQAIMSILCGAQRKSLPMDNARHAGNKPGKKQDDWVYHDDNC
ncbi:hypothetical protein ACHAXR_007101 [Thalassiosira sp. AJA248-18]